MASVLERFYPIVATLLLVGIVVLSFLLGREEGRRATAPPVVLSCENLSMDPSVKGESSIASGNTSEGSEYGSIRETAQGDASLVPKGAFVGSKNGTKYYRPECPGVARIKPENYIWFTSEDDAKLQGYSPAQC